MLSAAGYLVLSVASGSRFVSPKIPLLHNARIVWELPTGTSILLQRPAQVKTASRIDFTLKNVYVGKGNRQDLEGSFTFWSKRRSLQSSWGKVAPAAFRLPQANSISETNASSLYYAGRGDFLVVTSPVTDSKAMLALGRLYHRIKVVG